MLLRIFNPVTQNTKGITVISLPSTVNKGINTWNIQWAERNSFCMSQIHCLFCSVTFHISRSFVIQMYECISIADLTCISCCGQFKRPRFHILWWTQCNYLLSPKINDIVLIRPIKPHLRHEHPSVSIHCYKQSCCADNSVRKNAC